MPSKTIIYYSSNHERPELEAKVVEGIERVRAGCPVISVTQKPMSFGKNICVGDVGLSYLNAFRQLLIGCQEATTEYVIMAESDVFYPPTGYFDFEPTDPEVIYSYNKCWIIWQNGNDWFYYKEQTHASIIYRREFIIDLLKRSFVGLPEWSRTKVNFPFYTLEHRFCLFGGLPLVHVKTGNGVQKGTRVSREVKPVRSLEYWGSGREFKAKIFNTKGDQG